MAAALGTVYSGATFDGNFPYNWYTNSISLTKGQVVLVFYNIANTQDPTNYCMDTGANGGNTYLPFFPVGPNTSNATMNCYVTVAQATENVVIKVVDGSTNFGQLYVILPTGVSSSLRYLLDGAGFSALESSDTTSHTSTSITTANPNDLLIAFLGQQQNSMSTPYFTDNSGFSFYQDTQFYALSSKHVSSTGTYSDSVTSQALTRVCSFLVAIQDAPTVTGINPKRCYPYAGNIAYNVDVVAGDLIIVAVANNNVNDYAATCSDSAGNTYNNILGNGNGGVYDATAYVTGFLFYAKAATTTTLTNITVAFSSSQSPSIIIQVVSGCGASLATIVDTYNSYVDSAVTTTHTGPSITTTNAYDYVFSFFFQSYTEAYLVENGQGFILEGRSNQGTAQAGYLTLSNNAHDRILSSTATLHDSVISHGLNGNTDSITCGNIIVAFKGTPISSYNPNQMMIMF